jgi:hypothetical protein
MQSQRTVVASKLELSTLAEISAIAKRHRSTLTRDVAAGRLVHHRDARSPLEAGANHWGNLQTLGRSCHRNVTEHAKKEARDRPAR